MTGTEKKTVSPQVKWNTGGLNHQVRYEMLAMVNESRSYAASSWKKLPHVLKKNLERFTWTD